MRLTAAECRHQKTDEQVDRILGGLMATLALAHLHRGLPAQSGVVYEFVMGDGSDLLGKFQKSDPALIEAGNDVRRPVMDAWEILSGCVL